MKIKTKKMQKTLFIAMIILFASCQSSKESGNQQSSDNAETVQQTTTAPELAYLLALNGKYPYESELFETDPLKSRLKKLLGDEAYFNFTERMGVQVPIEVNGNQVFMEGLKAHSGGSDEAAILVDVEKNLIWALTFSDGKNLQVYKDDRDVEMPKRFFDKVVGYN
jgi:hypothetical protein